MPQQKDNRSLERLTDVAVQPDHPHHPRNESRPLQESTAAMLQNLLLVTVISKLQKLVALLNPKHPTPPLNQAPMTILIVTLPTMTPTMYAFLGPRILHFSGRHFRESFTLKKETDIEERILNIDIIPFVFDVDTSLAKLGRPADGKTQRTMNRELQKLESYAKERTVEQTRLTVEQTS